MRIEPLGEQIVVVPIEEKVTRGGIHLPETQRDQKKIRSGKVLAVGPGKFNAELCKFFPPSGERGERKEPINVAPGDLVLWGQYSGVEHEMEGVKVVLVPNSEILGIVKE